MSEQIPPIANYGFAGVALFLLIMAIRDLKDGFSRKVDELTAAIKSLEARFNQHVDSRAGGQAA